MSRVVGKLRRMAARVKHSLVPPPPPPGEVLSGKLEDFVCNVCGHENRGVPTEHVQNREFQSCGNCRSSLRMRSVMHTLSQELFGRAMTLPDAAGGNLDEHAVYGDHPGGRHPLAAHRAV